MGVISVKIQGGFEGRNSPLKLGNTLKYNLIVNFSNSDKEKFSNSDSENFSNSDGANFNNSDSKKFSSSDVGIFSNYDSEFLKLNREFLEF